VLVLRGAAAALALSPHGDPSRDCDNNLQKPTARRAAASFAVGSMQRKGSFHVVDWRQKTAKTPVFSLFHDPVVDTVRERMQVFTPLRCNAPEERSR
jgi:hypothetical protein